MFRKLVVLSTLVCAVLYGAHPTTAADRPTAPRLLPESTLAYVRIGDVNEMREATEKSGFGRMMQDEQLKPLVGDIYLAATQLFTEVSDRVGVSLDELLSIPQGEVAFAVVPLDTSASDEKQDGPKDDSPDAVRRRLEARRNRSPVGVVGFVEAGENAYLMRRVIERIETQIPQGGVKRTVRTVAGTDVIVYTGSGGGGNMPFSYAEKDGTFIMSVGPNLVDDVLTRWKEGGSKETLAQNTDFGNVMSHCVGAEETRPQLTFFVDPFHLIELIVKANGGAAGLVWPILDSLQFDKIKGIGGSSFSGGEDEFEGIIHIHMLLESPRDGMWAVVRPGDGSIQPEPWVPADIVSYTTLHWDLEKTYEGISRIVARIQDDKAMERFVETPLKERTGVEFRKEILEQLTGRIAVIRWNEPPMRLNSGTQAWAVETKDIVAVEKTMEKLLEKFNVQWQEETFAGKKIYVIEAPQRGNLPESFRRPEPTLALIGNYIVGSDSRKAIEHFILTEGGSAQKLTESPEYDLIASEVSGKLDSEKPFLFTFMRSEEVFRQIYDLAKEPSSRQFLKQAGENNRVAKMLVDALEKNELPAFSAFTKYFAPSGAFAYDDPTGLHYATFTLKPIE